MRYREPMMALSLHRRVGARQIHLVQGPRSVPAGSPAHGESVTFSAKWCRARSDDGPALRVRHFREQPPLATFLPSDTMILDPAELSAREKYSWMTRLIVPRPIAWVSTISIEGTLNLAPFSYFNGVGTTPLTLMFCPANNVDGSPKDTLKNVRDTGEFVVNVVTESFAQTMNQSSAAVTPDVDEFDLAGLEHVPSDWVKPPRVAAIAAAFECRLHTAIALAAGPAAANVVIGEVLGIHIDDSRIHDGQFDDAALDAVARMGGKTYARTGDRFELDRPTAP